MSRPNGIHHLALSTANMKEQFEFFTQVLGFELVALYPMHGNETGWHGFLRMNDNSLLGFVQFAKNKDVPIQIGVTHPGHGAGTSAGGTMQHLAFRVNTLEELEAMRDRIRLAGYSCFGPADHGMCYSIYFWGPENMTLEVACPGKNPLVVDEWLDPNTLAAAGINADDVQRMRNPPKFERPAQPVAQPAYDPTKYHPTYRKEVYDKLLAMSDDEMNKSMSWDVSPTKKLDAEAFAG